MHSAPASATALALVMLCSTLAQPAWATEYQPGSAAAQAQDSGDSDSDNVQNVPEEDQQGEVSTRDADGNLITVTATRNSGRVFDYPGAVTVVDRSIIEDINPSSLADIFQEVPGVFSDGGPRRSGSGPAVRGLSGEGVLIYVDGARQSYQSGHDGRLFFDPALLQAVEVVRGPTSALYGSGALGGTIALRTITAADFLKPGERIGARLNAGYQGVNDEFLMGGIVAMRSSDNRYDFIGNVNFRLSQDIELGSGLELPSNDDIFSSLAKFTLRPSDALSLSLNWNHYTGDSVDPNNPQGANVAGPGNDNVNRRVLTDNVQFSTNFNPDSALINANLTAYYSRTNVREDIIADPRIIGREVETYGISFDNRSNFTLGDNIMLRLTYGGEYYEDRQRGFDNQSADGSRGGVPDAKRQIYGAFAQAELNARTGIGEFSLIPGVRWDRFENKASGQPQADDDKVSPKVGLSWKPVPQLILFGNWARAFRAPSYNEVYADGIHFQLPVFIPGQPPVFVSNSFISNPDLRPEDSETWEFGAGVDFDNLAFDGDSLSIKGSWYQSDVDDLISLDVNIPPSCFGAPSPPFGPCGSGLPFGNYTRNVNVRDARIDGVEVEGSYDSPWFYARANYATIDGHDRANGDYVGSLSPDIFFIDGGFKIAPIWLKIGGRLTVAGGFDKVDDPLEARDSWERGDVYLVWEPELGVLNGLRIDLGINNIADADYEVVAAGVSEPGRNYKAAISWRKAF